MKLRRNEHCPIPKSLFCCGREQIKEERKSWTEVQRIEDPHHPRGYRERRSPAEMKKLLKRKIVEQGMKCGICGNDPIDFSDVVPDHKDPKGMGSARRDDHPDNIQAAHWRCNLEKRSRRVQAHETAPSVDLCGRAKEQRLNIEESGTNEESPSQK